MLGFPQLPDDLENGKGVRFILLRYCQAVERKRSQVYFAAVLPGNKPETLLISHIPTADRRYFFMLLGTVTMACRWVTLPLSSSAW
jgi:hypothetical protein